MVMSLYDLSVPTFLQTVKAVGGFLDRAVRHCSDTRADPDDFVHARLFDDMAPFHFQIEAAWHHSVWGLEAVKTGVFAPPALVGPVPFADLQAMIGKAETALKAFIPDEVNSWAGKDLDLQIGPRRLALTSETLILSFSLPNFYFHAVTAYDILRTRVCRSESAITRAGCALGPPRPVPYRTLSRKRQLLAREAPVVLRANSNANIRPLYYVRG